MLEFDFPVPPSVNHYYRNFKGRVYISPKGKSYQKTVAAIVADRGSVEPLEGKVGVKIEFYPPDRRRRDADNILKSLLDAIQAAQLFYDDSQIHDLSIQKKEVEKGGRVWVKLWELER